MKSPKARKFGEPGRCVFCGGTGLTKEHVWSNWLKSHVSQGIGHFASTAGYEYTKDRPAVFPTDDPTVTPKQGSAMQRKARKVCRSCNGGWMSRVVQRAKPLVEKLIAGTSIELSPDSNDALVQWIVLTVAMQHRSEPHAKAITTTDLSRLFHGQPPNDNWSVWIARYGGGDLRGFQSMALPIYGQRVASGSHQESDALSDYMQLNTFLIGEMIVHTFVATEMDVAEHYRREVRNFPVTIRLWPSSRAIQQWPPPWSMLDSDIDGLTFGWLRRKMRFPNLTFRRPPTDANRLDHLRNSVLVFW